MNIGNVYAMSGEFTVQAMSTVVLQIAPVTAKDMADVNANIDQICDWMERAVGGFPGVDLIVTPEFGCQGIGPDWKNVLLDLDSPEVGRLLAKCKELNVWGVFSVLVKEYGDHKARNMAILVNNQGEIALKYCKMNQFVPVDWSYPGDSCPVVDGPKGSRIALIICADGDYPEVWREAAYNGANVIVRITHYMAPYDKGWEITNKAGAYCNQIYVVGSSCVDINGTGTNIGHSMILNPDGTVITEAPLGLPWMIKADLYPQIVDKIRTEAVQNNFIWSYRRRGAAHPEVAGVGRPLSDYNAYRQDDAGKDV